MNDQLRALNAVIENFNNELKANSEIFGLYNSKIYFSRFHDDGSGNYSLRVDLNESVTGVKNYPYEIQGIYKLRINTVIFTFINDSWPLIGGYIVKSLNYCYSAKMNSDEEYINIIEAEKEAIIIECEQLFDNNFKNDIMQILESALMSDKGSKGDKNSIFQIIKNFALYDVGEYIKEMWQSILIAERVIAENTTISSSSKEGSLGAANLNKSILELIYDFS